MGLIDLVHWGKAVRDLRHLRMMLSRGNSWWVLALLLLTTSAASFSKTSWKMAAGVGSEEEKTCFRTSDKDGKLGWLTDVSPSRGLLQSAMQSAAGVVRRRSSNDYPAGAHSESFRNAKLTVSRKQLVGSVWGTGHVIKLKTGLKIGLILSVLTFLNRFWTNEGHLPNRLLQEVWER